MPKRPRSKNRDIDKLIVKCLNNGWEFWWGGKKILGRPIGDDTRPIPFPHSPGDTRAFLDTRAKVRRKQKELSREVFV